MLQSIRYAVDEEKELGLSHRLLKLESQGAGMCNGTTIQRLLHLYMCTCVSCRKEGAADAVVVSRL